MTGAPYANSATLLAALFGTDPATLPGAGHEQLDAYFASYEIVNPQDPSTHARLLGLGIAPAFLAIAAGGAVAVAAYVRQHAPGGELVLAQPAGVSPKVYDALLLAKTGQKFSLSPFTGELAATRHNAFTGWFAFLTGAPAFVTGACAQPFMRTQDNVWAIPRLKLILHLDAGIPDDACRAQLRACLGHILHARERFLAYVNTPSRRLAVYDWHCEHFGHYVWNTLSAWGAFIANGGAQGVDELVACQPGGYFGAIKPLFGLPASAPPQESAVENSWRLGLRLFPENLLAVSIQADFLTQATCDAVVRQSLAVCDAEFSARLAGLRAACWPLLLLSLRFENRAWDGQMAGFLALAQAVKAEFPGAGFVLHGISAGVPMGSTTSWMSLEEERAQAAALEAAFAAQGLELLSAVGEPLAAAVAVSEACDAFVAPIGSGMALYKWLTNKPGVAFSNRFALDPATPDRWSMMVFEHYRENIRPMLCVPLAAVTDLESERHGIANRANFTLDEAMLYATVKQMLLSLRLDPPPAAP